MRFLFTLLLGMLLVAAAQAATPIKPNKMGLDNRRYPQANLEQQGSWTQTYYVSPDTVISLTSPISGTTTAKYNLSPVTTWNNGHDGGTPCEFAIRTNGTGVPPTPGTAAASRAVGTGWEKNRLSGWIDANISDTTPGYVAFRHYCSTDAWLTVNWESMLAQ